VSAEKHRDVQARAIPKGSSKARNVTLWRHKSRYEDQWNRIEDPDLNLCSDTHLISYKAAKKPIMEKRQPLQEILLGKLDICMQKTKTRSMCVALHKEQLKMDQGP
jgi:hypothetical protein